MRYYFLILFLFYVPLSANKLEFQDNEIKTVLYIFDAYKNGSLDSALKKLEYSSKAVEKNVKSSQQSRDLLYYFEKKEKRFQKAFGLSLNDIPYDNYRFEIIVSMKEKHVSKYVRLKYKDFGILKIGFHRKNGSYKISSFVIYRI